MSNQTDSARVGIDMGGTFTDAVWLEDGEIQVVKVPTTPTRHAEGFRAALDKVAERADGELGGVGYLAHGTTTATNALVQGRIAKVGLLTTAGFRDVIEIGTQRRTDLYDPRVPEPPPLVERDLRLEVEERISPDGTVLTPLDEDEVARAAARFHELGVEAVAISFLFAFKDGSHERQARDLLRETLGQDFPVSISSDVAPEVREYPRTSTTVINASLLPLMGEYVEGMTGAKDEAGVGAQLNLMQSSGGLADASRGARAPVNLIASGPAGGVIGARILGQELGLGDLLTFDMGGTTADVALVVGGDPQFIYAGEAGGHPVALPQIEILSVGAGAGSIARVDEFGSLKVGPESAGADPGPAAYRRGGTDATVADAHLVTGALEPAAFLGGRMEVNLDAARDAIDKNVAGPLGVPVEDAALAILRIADATMVGTIRIMTLARGHDPRDFTLVAFGGAGPLHACSLAEEAGMRKVLVPRFPGAGSAVGLLLSDVRCDRQQSWIQPVAETDMTVLRNRLRELADSAVAEIEEGSDGAAGVEIEFALDMRYQGQAYEITVPMGDGIESLDAELLTAEFNQAHERTYGHSLTEPVELVTLRAAAIRPTGLSRLSRAAKRDGEDRRSRMIHLGRHGEVEFQVIKREEIPVGQALAGPILVEQEDSTTVIPPGWSAIEHDQGSLLLERVK